MGKHQVNAHVASVCRVTVSVTQSRAVAWQHEDQTGLRTRMRVPLFEKRLKKEDKIKQRGLREELERAVVRVICDVGHSCLQRMRGISGITSFNRAILII